MRNPGQTRRGPSEKGTRAAPSGTKRVVLMAYAVWVVVVLLAAVPHLAETGTRQALGGGEYAYSPQFTHDGEIEHYEVERADKGEDGSIDIIYDSEIRTVYVEAINIESLTVDCESIAREKSSELMESDSVSMRLVHQYFYDMGHLYVNTQSTDDVEITWKDMPVPVAVVADGEPYEEEWETDGGDIVITAPEGEHYYILYFAGSPEFPTAVISVNHPVTLVGHPVRFDGSDSEGGEGPEGYIEDYLWDLDTGDDVMVDRSGVEAERTYEKAGTYTVSLTVRNGYHLKDTAHTEIVVKKKDASIDMDGDGKPDWNDEDIDGDGWENDDETRLGTVPTIFDSVPPDMDGDFITDPEDDDRDGDTHDNDEDAYPDDPERWEAEGGDKEGRGAVVAASILVLAVVAAVISVLLLVLMARSKKKKEEGEAEAQKQAAAQGLYGSKVPAHGAVAAGQKAGQTAAEAGYTPPVPQRPAQPVQYPGKTSQYPGQTTQHPGQTVQRPSQASGDPGLAFGGRAPPTRVVATVPVVPAGSSQQTPRVQTTPVVSTTPVAPRPLGTGGAPSTPMVQVTAIKPPDGAVQRVAATPTYPALSSRTDTQTAPGPNGEDLKPGVRKASKEEVAVLFEKVSAEKSNEKQDAEDYDKYIDNIFDGVN